MSTENQNELFNTEYDPSLLDHVTLDDEHQNLWPSLLLELHDVLDNELKTKHIDSEQLALDLTLAIGEHMGGFQVYIPRGDRLRQQIRDMRIFNEFDGRNVYALAKKYKLTSKTIYEIIARMRKIESKKRQLQLFD